MIRKSDRRSHPSIQTFSFSTAVAGVLLVVLSLSPSRVLASSWGSSLPSSLSSIGQNSLKLTGKLLKGTARQSGKAALNVVKPVHRSDILGLWKIEPEPLEHDHSKQPLPPPVTIRIQSNGIVLTQKTSKKNNNSLIPYDFEPTKYGIMDATLNFQIGSYLFQGRVVRKVADPSVLKLRGKLYHNSAGNGLFSSPKRKIGRFRGKRRLEMKLMEEDDWSDDEEEEEEEEEEKARPNDAPDHEGKSDDDESVLDEYDGLYEDEESGDDNPEL